MDHELDRNMQRLAAHQHGLVARAQARAMGLSEVAWRHRLERGWEPVTRRVARRLGAPVTDHQRVLAAVLDQGPSTYASHGTAAAMWGLPGFDLASVEVIVVRGGRETQSALATCHRPRHLPDPFAAQLDAIPVVRPSLLLLQIAPRVSPARLARMLDNLWTRRLVSGPSVAAELAGVMHRGRAGTAAMRHLLKSLPPDYVPAASGLEARFSQILNDAGLPPFRRQVDVGDGEQWCGRVDFIDPHLPLVVEVDSERYHSALTDVRADQTRQTFLEEAGYLLERITDVDVWHRPRVVVDRIRAARARLRAAAA